MPKPRKKAKKVTPKKSKDVPVTQKMLFRVRDELKNDFSSVRSEVKSLEKRMDARFNKMESRFSDIDARFNKMESRFSDIDARFNKMESRFSDIDAKFDLVFSKLNSMEAQFSKMFGEIHRVALLVEEQNARNKFVLDGYASLHDRQAAIELEIAEIKKSNRSV